MYIDAYSFEQPFEFHPNKLNGNPSKAHCASSNHSEFDIGASISLSGAFSLGATSFHCPEVFNAAVVLEYPRAVRYAALGLGLNVRAKEPHISTLTCDMTRSFASRKGFKS